MRWEVVAAVRREKVFLYQVAFHEPKKCLYREPKSFSLAESFTNFTQSRFYAQKLLLHVPFFAVRKYFQFLQTKSFSFAQTFLLPPKATLFHPPLPIPTILNLLSTKNTAVLLQSALILCCKAGASHRFKSLPAIPGEVAAFRKTGYLMMAAYFSENHVSTGDLNRPRSPEVRKPLACFLILFARRKKNVKTSPFRESFEVLQTSIQPTAVTSSHRNN